MNVHAHGNPHHNRQSHRKLHGDHRTAAASYLLGPVSGLLVYVLADHRDRYARWHAVQSVGVGLALALVGLLASALTLYDLGTSRGMLGMSAAMSVYWIAAGAVVCLFAVAAYRGDRVRIPFLSDFADRHA